MKKIILPITIFIITIAACTKENANKDDEYKNYLTKAEWTMSTSSIINDTVTEHYTNGQPDEVFTLRHTTTIGTGTRKDEMYQLQQEVGFADYSRKETYQYNFSIRYKFNEGGVYSINQSTQLVSLTYEQTGTPVTTAPITQPTATSSESKSWSWQNIDDMKYILTLDLGSLEVASISENTLILKLNTSDSKTVVINPQETKIVKTSQAINIKMIR